MYSGFEKNLLGNRGVGGLYSEESGEKELSGKGSSLKLRPREGERLEGSKWNLVMVRYLINWGKKVKI